MVVDLGTKTAELPCVSKEQVTFNDCVAQALVKYAKQTTKKRPTELPAGMLVR